MDVGDKLASYTHELSFRVLLIYRRCYGLSLMAEVFESVPSVLVGHLLYCSFVDGFDVSAKSQSHLTCFL